MTFNTPNVSDILNTLIGNDALISVLKESGALITREKLLNEYHKSVMAKTVREANLRNLEMMQDIAELILANEEHIRKESIWQLTAEEFLFKEIRSIFGLEKANDNLYQSIFYCYKYCYVSSFFQNNADKFIPECDIEEIRGNPAAEAFLDAMLKEFDKINRLLEETKDYLDYDKIPSLRIEARQKLKMFKPVSIGQASRISGVSPADISVLIVYLEHFKKQ